MQKKKLQWHPAFFASLQIELEAESANLEYENEHQLGTKPKAIDVLVIKKRMDIPIRKNIGRIFRKYNIIEYKSPEDYLSIDDFYKVYGYACFYKSDAASVNGIRADEITITFMPFHYPKKMMHRIAEDRHYRIEKSEPGIYEIFGDPIPMQLIVTAELGMEENLWLCGLTNQLKSNSLGEKLLNEYEKNKDKMLYDSVMELILTANEDAWKGDVTMCEALERIMADKLKDRERQGIEQGIEQGISALVETCRELGISKEETQKKLMEKFGVGEKEAEISVEKYWK